MSKPVLQRLVIPSALVVAIATAAGCSGGGNNTNPAEGTSTAPMPAAPAPTTSARSPLYNPATGTTAAAGSTAMTPAAAGTSANADMGNFAAKAEQGGMFEIQLAELALQKTKDSDVKSFAERMKKDHTAADDKLKDAVGSDTQLPDHIAPDQQAKVDSLKSKDGNDFDKAYADIAVENHQKTISLFEDASKNAPTQQLRDFASQTLPTLKEHLELAQQLQSKEGS